MAPRCVLVPLDREGIEVWIHDIDLDTVASQRNGIARLLSDAEHARAARFRFAFDQERFIAARGTLRRILAEHGAGPAERLVVVEGQWGKPAVVASSPLWFNVTHSGSRALVAVTRSAEVGIDLEVVRPLTNVLELARFSCTDAEIAALAALPPAERDVAFQRCWVRKEACTKASGVGLQQPFDEVEVGVATTAGPVVVTSRVSRTAMAVTVVDLDVGPRHVAALAVGLPGVGSCPSRPLANGAVVCMDTHQ